MNNNMNQSRRFKVELYEGSGDKCVECQQVINSGAKIVKIEEEKGEDIHIFYKPGKYHFLCLAKQEYFIAFIDILGFSKLTLDLSLDKIYEIIKQFFIAARFSRVEASIGRETRPIADVPYMVISDSIVLYQIVRPPNNNMDFFEWKEQIFSQFLTSLEEIFKEAFKLNLHLRCGISYGECIISQNFSDDSIKKEHILIGRPFTEAVKMENLQLWMGAAFHPSMNDYLEKSVHKSSLIESTIPSKKNSEIKEIPNYTIAWIDASLQRYKNKFEEWQTENPYQEEIKSNTIKFYENNITRSQPLRHIGKIVFNPN